jgi:hypothetical protein
VLDSTFLWMLKISSCSMNMLELAMGGEIRWRRFLSWRLS